MSLDIDSEWGGVMIMHTKDGQCIGPEPEMDEEYLQINDFVDAYNNRPIETALAAERDRLQAEVERLRALCKEAAEYIADMSDIDSEGYMDSSASEIVIRLYPDASKWKEQEALND